MSFLPFIGKDAAAATMSNLVLYKKQVVITTTAGTSNYVIYDTEGWYGRFVPLEVWFHVDDNGGNDQRQFTASIGYGLAPAAICPSAVRGTTGTTAALQLRVNKAVRFPTNIATTYATGYASNEGAVTQPVYLQVTVPPAGQITGTFFVVGYYTGMRP